MNCQVKIKEDWHSEEITCIALGLEDFFQPKQNLKKGKFIGAKVLECTSVIRIKLVEMKSEDLDVTTKSGLEFQAPKDLIASTKLDKLRLQPAPCITLKGHDENSSEDYDKEIGSSQQHSFKEIQVNYTMTSAEANKGVRQILIGGGQASETLKAKRDVNVGAQNHCPRESDTVGKFP